MATPAHFGLRDLARKNEQDSRKEVSSADIGMAAITGFDAEDIETIRILCLENQLLIIIRCARRASRYNIGILPPKPAAAKSAKSDPETGIGTTSYTWVSDYDLMSIWEAEGGGKNYVKIPGYKDKAGKCDPRFPSIMRIFNHRLRHRFQHGTNDDYVDHQTGKLLNPSRNFPNGRFVAFTETAHVLYIKSLKELERFYRVNRLRWPYAD